MTSKRFVEIGNLVEIGTFVTLGPLFEYLQTLHDIIMIGFDLEI